MKKLILFVHGLGGNKDTTWGKFEELIQHDEELGFDVGFFGYSTWVFSIRALFRKVGSLNDLANSLRTEIEARYSGYKEIILVGHSLGGLVIRQYLLNEHDRRNLKTKKIILFGVPSDGAELANIASLISWKHNQLKAICRGSEELSVLNQRWVDSQIDQNLFIEVVFGGQDRVVSRESAQNIFRNRQPKRIDGKNHRNLVKPDDSNDLTYQILRRFVLQSHPITAFQFPGAITFETWSEIANLENYDYVSDESRDSAIHDLLTILQQPQKCARIMGLSGLGKTRLAFEAIKKIVSQDNSQPVLYIDAAEATGIQQFVDQLVNEEASGILVIDNCHVTLESQLARKIHRHNSKLSLLSIDNDLKRSESSEIITLEAMDAESIKKILVQAFGGDFQDLDRIAEFSDGWPQMAILLGKARQVRDVDIGQLSDDELAAKLLWGNSDPVPNQEKMLQACSVFDRFGVRKEAKNELEFIANHIANVGYDEIYSCVSTFETRGIIDKRGRFSRIVPKPLAIRLAKAWWQTNPPEIHDALVGPNLPETMVESLCEQISRLDSAPNVKAFVRSLCGEPVPFGPAKEILSDRGSLLFRYLVEVDPECTSDALYRTLSVLGFEELKSITGDVRRNLVFALEKLCFHESVFNSATHSLLLLASAENESWSNNASGQVKQLFRPVLSGTEAGPSQRIDFIDSILRHSDPKQTSVIIKCMDAALSHTRASRTLGAEVQGTRAALKEWRPETWKELFDYWESVLLRLTEVATSGEPSRSKLAKKAIAGNLRELVRHGRIAILDRALKEINKSDHPEWPEAINAIRATKKYDSEKLPAKALKAMSEWEKLFAPTSITEKIAQQVSMPPYENETDNSGNFVNIAERNARLLASEIAVKIELVFAHFEQLSTGEQRQAFTFGDELATLIPHPSDLIEKVVEFVASHKDSNPSFMFGLLNGIRRVNPALWDKFETQFKSETRLCRYYPNLVASSSISEQHLQTVFELVEDKKIDASSISVLTFGGITKHLSHAAITEFATKVSAVSDEAAWAALDVLIMYSHGALELRKLVTPAFSIVLSKLQLASRSSDAGMSMYNWKTAAAWVLKEDDSDAIKKLVNDIICSTIGDQADYGQIWNYFQPIIREALTHQSAIAWPLIKEVIEESPPTERWKLEQLLGKNRTNDDQSDAVILSLPKDLIVQWCSESPEKAPAFVLSTIKLFEFSDNGTPIFTELAKFCIDNYGEDDRVLSAISVNIGTFSAWGSVVPHYELEESLYQSLSQHESKPIRIWAKRMALGAAQLKAGASQTEEEHEWGIY